MLSSIHPLGERARHNRWWLTVSAFTVGAVGTGAIAGGLLGFLGDMTLSALSPGDALALTAGTIVVAGLLDLLRIDAPGPRRQVNETWIGAYRGWVYGGGFGIQLGLGVATYVVTWGVYATFASQVLSASATTGVIIGAAFGLGRSIPLIVAGVIDRPSRLTSFNRILARIGPGFRVATGLAFGLMGVAALLGGASWLA